MTYYPDFSDYTYFPDMYRPYTKNIGWLSAQVGFKKAPPSAEILDLLWDFCAVSTAVSRGYHFCEFCNNREYGYAEKSGVKLRLGGSEIRVLPEDGEIYAAPNLVYHYVQEHHYKLPDKFVAALLRGPKPPDPAYYDRLDKLGLEWQTTAVEGEDGMARIDQALLGAVGQQLNCNAECCGSQGMKVDWQDDLIHIITFNLDGHPTLKHVHAWYMKPKGTEPNPHFIVMPGTNPWLSKSEEEAVKASIEEYRILDETELDRKYGRLNERYDTDDEIMSEFKAFMHRWPGR